MAKSKKIKFILRQLNGETCPENKKAFSQWLLESSENFDLYIEIKEIWELAMTKSRDFDPVKAERRINQVIHKKERNIRWWLSTRKAAAIIIIAVSISTCLYQFRKQDITSKEVLAEKIITKKSGLGEQLRVTLPDGSIARLNAGSIIRFPQEFDTHIRKVTLQGEAFFEVTKDTGHPFVVVANEITTTVLGTSFNVKAFDVGNVTITVATGKVKVENNQKGSGNKLLLHPNEQATYNKRGETFSVTEVAAKNYYAWAEGVIRFNNDELDDVISVLERWYNVTIELNNPGGRKKVKVNGSYKDKKLYTILDGLCFMYDLSYRYEHNNKIVITIKR